MPKQMWFTLIFFAVIFVIFGLPLTILGIRDQVFYLTLLGLGILAIPALMIGIPLRQYLIKKRVKANGTLIKARFLKVRMAEYSVNNYRPYIILSQWYDPVANLVYRFKSGAVPFDPSSYIPKGDSIPVWIDPKNPKHYAVDLDQIPRLASHLARKDHR